MKKKRVSQIYHLVTSKLKRGKEETKEWLMRNFFKLPKDFQEKLIFSFFEKGLMQAVEENKRTISFQKKLIAKLKSLEKTKTSLEKKITGKEKIR